jgi:DNA polymerase III epsilon subunit-like protein
MSSSGSSFPLMVFFDLETTGLDTQTAETVELAGKVFPDGPEFNERVRPVQSIPVESTKIHGISQQDVQTASPFKEVFSRFVAFLDEQRQKMKRIVFLVSHNNFHFDMPILEAECKRCSFAIPNWIWFADTLDTMQNVFRLPRSELALQTLSKELLKSKEAQKHTAIDDTKLLVNVVNAMASGKKELFIFSLQSQAKPSTGCPSLSGTPR